MNGGAGERFWVRVPTLVTTGWSASIAARCRSAASASVTSSASPSILTTSASNRSPAAVARSASIVQYSRAVNARDLALAFDDEADRDRLDATGRQAAADLARQQRTERVADETVDDAARLLRVDEVHVDLARMREGLADRRFGDLVEGDPQLLVAPDVGGFGDVPGDRLAFAIEVGGEEDHVGRLGRLGDLGDLLCAGPRRSRIRGRSRGRRRRRTCPCRGSRAGRGRDRTRPGPGNRRRDSARWCGPWQAIRR